MTKVLGITGHRPQYFKDGELLLWASLQIHEAVKRAIDAGFSRFISGGALGVDQLFADWVLFEKRKNPQLHLTIARPFPSQDVRWSMPDRIKYLGLLRDADLVVDVSDDPYDVRKMFTRNRWIVDKSTAMVATLGSDVNRGGTYQCVRYAGRKNIPVFMIDPVSKGAKWK